MNYLLLGLLNAIISMWYIIINLLSFWHECAQLSFQLLCVFRIFFKLKKWIVPIESKQIETKIHISWCIASFRKDRNWIKPSGQIFTPLFVKHNWFTIYRLNIDLHAVALTELEHTCLVLKNVVFSRHLSLWPCTAKLGYNLCV